MAATLTVNHYDQETANLVTPTSPLKKDNSAPWTQDMLTALGDIKLLSNIIKRMDNGDGIPVLLRQYLGFNGHLVCFNVDRDFNDALDGLIVVDLRKASPKVIGRYMGKKEAKSYLSFHQKAGVVK